jgi:hypothetical protein
MARAQSEIEGCVPERAAGEREHYKWKAAEAAGKAIVNSGANKALLAKAKEVVDRMASSFGESDRAVVLLRRMLAFGQARCDGKVELSESELGKLSRKGRCFVATAACGTEWAPDVVALRRFREAILRPTGWGRTAIGAYEALSPPVAAWLERSPAARAAVRLLLVRPCAWAANRLAGVGKGQ